MISELYTNRLIKIKKKIDLYNKLELESKEKIYIYNEEIEKVKNEMNIIASNQNEDLEPHIQYVLLNEKTEVLYDILQNIKSISRDLEFKKKEILNEVDNIKNNIKSNYSYSEEVVNKLVNKYLS